MTVGVWPPHFRSEASCLTARGLGFLRVTVLTNSSRYVSHRGLVSSEQSQKALRTVAGTQWTLNKFLFFSPIKINATNIFVLIFKQLKKITSMKTIARKGLKMCKLECKFELFM